MKKFEELVEELNKDIVIPDTVNQKFEETLSKLEVSERKKNYKWMKAASVVAAFVMASGLLLALNPAMASNIPIIGNIFELVENKVNYSGDYSNKQILSESETSNAIITTEDKDIKITASEVYSDGFSVFVTMKMDSTKYDFSKIRPYVETGGKGIAMTTSYGISTDVGEYDYDINLEGYNEGESTFIGMAKFDKTDYSMENGYINIKIKTIYIENPDDLEKGLSTVNGNWNLKIPYETDKENGKEINVNQKTNTDLTVKKLFVSPYQMVVLSDVPYTMPYGDTYDGEIEKMGEELDEALIEEMRNIKSYEFYEMAIFDQNGNPLDWEEMGDGEGELKRDMYSLRGKDVSQIHIYITQNEDDIFELIKAKTEKEAEKISEYDFVVDIK